MFPCAIWLNKNYLANCKELEQTLSGTALVQGSLARWSIYPIYVGELKLIRLRYCVKAGQCLLWSTHILDVRKYRRKARVSWCPQSDYISWRALVLLSAMPEPVKAKASKCVSFVNVTFPRNLLICKYISCSQALSDRCTLIKAHKTEFNKCVSFGVHMWPLISQQSNVSYTIQNNHNRCNARAEWEQSVFHSLNNCGRVVWLTRVPRGFHFECASFTDLHWEQIFRVKSATLPLVSARTAKLLFKLFSRGWSLAPFRCSIDVHSSVLGVILPPYSSPFVFN